MQIVTVNECGKKDDLHEVSFNKDFWQHTVSPVLISGPSLGAKAKVLSFNRTQHRAVTGLRTAHNTLRRHLHLLGLLEEVWSERGDLGPHPL